MKIVPGVGSVGGGNADEARPVAFGNQTTTSGRKHTHIIRNRIAERKVQLRTRAESLPERSAGPPRTRGPRRQSTGSTDPSACCQKMDESDRGRHGRFLPARRDRARRGDEARSWRAHVMVRRCLRQRLISDFANCKGAPPPCIPVARLRRPGGRPAFRLRHRR